MAVIGQQVCLILAQGPGFQKAGLAGQGQFGLVRLPGGKLRFTDKHGQQIRIREIAVIVGFFLAAHGLGGIVHTVIKPCFLHNNFAVIKRIFAALLCLIGMKMLLS